MRFYFRTCCCLFQLHHGFIFTIYYQLPKFIWTLFVALSGLLNSSTIKISYVFYTFNIFAAVNESFFSMRSYLVGLKLNNYRIHRQFFFAKLLFVMASFISLGCANMTPFSMTWEKNISIVYSINFFVSLFDIYLLIVIYFFAVRVRRGYYGQMGVEPVFHNSMAPQLDSIMSGIVLETQGFRLLNYNEKEIEIGIPLNSKKRFPNTRKDYKKYFKVYPNPLINNSPF